LRDPRPHPFARRVDGDGMSRREDGVRNHRVDSKRTAPFDGSCKAGGERHTGMEEHLPYRLQIGRPGVNRERLSAIRGCARIRRRKSPASGGFSRAVPRFRHIETFGKGVARSVSGRTTSRCSGRSPIACTTLRLRTATP
jgi:hypothetical protein